MYRPVFVILLLLLFFAGCEKETGVYILFEAGTESRQQSETLTVNVCNQEGELVRQENLDSSDALSARLPLAPRDNDASRVFALVAELGGSDTPPLSRQTVVAGYREEEIHEITVRFEDDCINVLECGVLETCRAGACVDARESEGLLIHDALPCGDVERGVVSFENVASTAGVMGSQNEGGDWQIGYGIAWGDYNVDGHVDLWLGCGHGEELPPCDLLYKNLGDGSFQRVTNGPRAYRAGSWADVEGDGDLDLVVSNFVDAGDAGLFINEGGDTFREAWDDLGFATTDNLGSPVWLDVERDGDIDIFLPNGDEHIGPNEIWLNDGENPPTFSIASMAGIDVGAGNGESTTVADVDNDGDQDIWYFDEGDGSLYINERTGFTEFSNEANLVVDIDEEHQRWYPAVFGDYNNDGWLDLFLGHQPGTANRLYTNLALSPVSFRLETSALFLGEDRGDSIGASWGDVDNDGDLDLAVGNDSPSEHCLYRNDGEEGFIEISASVGLRDEGAVPTRSLAFADYDNDGDLDLYVTNIGAPNELWQNQLDDVHYLKVRVIGRGGNGFSTVDGIGTRVDLLDESGQELLAIREVSGGEGFGSQSPAMLHFGLAQRWGGGTGTYSIRAHFVSGDRLRADVVPIDATTAFDDVVLTNTIEIRE